MAPTNVDESGATFRAEVLFKGSAQTVSYGFIWGTSDPKINNSFEVVLGQDIKSGFFETRINNSLVEGLFYEIRAFATLPEKTVYGNTISLKSLGSELNPWALELSDYKLNGYSESFGSSEMDFGYILFQSSIFYKYDPHNNSITHETSFPISGNSGTRYKSAAIGKAQYFMSSQQQAMFKFESNNWSVLTETPFAFNNSGMWEPYSGQVYVLSSSQSYAYDPQTNFWQLKSRVPISGEYMIGSTSFDSKAYIITNRGNIWEYNFSTDIWKYETIYPAPLGEKLMVFSIDNGLYFGLSHKGYWIDGEDGRKLWTYDPTSNTWVMKALFPITLGSADICYFTIDNKLYVSHGYDNYNFWSFDTQKIE